MEEVYAIGVRIALGGDIGRVIQQLVKQFEALDKAIQSVQGNVLKLIPPMQSLAREGKTAADNWKSAAVSMERAARAAGQIGSPSRRVPPSPPESAGAAADAGPAVPPSRAPRPSGPAIPLMYYGANAGALVPSNDGRSLQVWRNPATGGTIVGNPYTPYGGYSLGAPRSTPLMLGYDAPGSSFTMQGGPQTVPGTGFTMQGSPYVPGTALVPGGPGGRPPMPPGGGPGGIVPGGGIRPIPLNFPPTPKQPGNPMLGGISAYFGGEFLEDTFGKSAAVDNVLHQLAAAGFSDQQQQAAKIEAFRLQRKVQPSTVLGNLQTLLKMQSVVQNPEEALGLLPDFTVLGTQLARSGHGNIEELFAAIKAGEYRGVLSKFNPQTGKNEIDLSGLHEFVKGLLVTSVISGGAVDPQAMLQLLRSANYAGANLSDTEFFAKTLAFQQAIGSSGAGRSLQGFIQQFGAGKMSEGAANLLLQMGILNGGGTARHNRFMLKAGMGQFLLLPGAMDPKLQMEASTDPSIFITKYLLPKIQEFLAKSFGKTYTGADPHTRSIMEMNYAGTITSRQPGARELSEAVRLQALLDRDLAAYEAGLRRPMGELLMNNNAQVASEGLSSSIDAFQVTLGSAAMKSAIGTFDSLTGSLNSLAEWSSKHSTETRIGMEALAGAVTGLGAAAVLSALAALGPAGVAVGGATAGLVALAAEINNLKHVVGSFLDVHVPWTKGDPETELDKIAKDPRFSKLPWWKRLTLFPPWDPRFSGGPSAPADSSPQSVAPPAASPSASAPVHITNQPTVNVGNPSDLVNGISKGQANQMNRPQPGASSYDVNQSAFGATFPGAF